MPKGRGARDRGRRPGKKGERSKRKGTGFGKGILGPSNVGAAESMRRSAAVEAGGFTREERRKSRQREAEAERVAAGKVARAARDRL